MQFSSIATILSVALAASAIPTEMEARTGGGGGGGKGKTCSNSNAKQVCCNGLLSCVVQVLGSGCTSGGAYCCTTDAPVGALINIALLNCVDIL